MAISLETSGITIVDGSASGTLQLTLTNSQILIVQISFWIGGGQAISSVVWNGQNLTKPIGQAYANIQTDLWYLVNPTTGTKTITVTFTANTKAIIIGYGLVGINTSSPWGTTGSSTGTGTSVSVNITTQFDNSWVLQALSIRQQNYATITEGSGQTIIRDGTVGTSGYGLRGHGSYEPTTTAGTYTSDWTLSASESWAMVHAEIKVAGGATYTKTWQSDVLFKKLGITKTAAVDSLFKKRDIQIQKQVDALFKKLNILKQCGVDVDLLKKDIIKTFAVDARFGAMATYTISKQIDALFKKLGITKTFGIDADFKKTLQVQKQVDSIFKKVSTITKQVDVLFKKFGITKTFAVDVWFGTVGAVTYTKAFAIDVMFRYKIKLPSPLGLTLDGQLVMPLKREVWVGD